ncbi:MAG: SAM-dependent methyltransferase, partial [Pseudomonadota bacterium]
AAKPRAPITILHRAAELARLLSLMDRWGGDLTVLPIHPRPDAPANRVLVRMRKGLRRGEVRLLPGLSVYAGTSGGALSRELDVIKRGMALDWPPPK